MELDHYLESVRRSVENATALADDQTRSVAQRLGATLDDAGRLALISALSDAAGEISRELSPGSVELRMAGGRPEFVVTPAPSQLTGPDEADDDTDDDTETEATDQVTLDADEPTARITLRLPMSVKNKVDEAAAAEGISSNAWLMRTVMTELGDRNRRGNRPPRPRARRVVCSARRALSVRTGRSDPTESSDRTVCSAPVAPSARRASSDPSAAGAAATATVTTGTGTRSAVAVAATARASG